jgi:hypothetical protein
MVDNEREIRRIEMSEKMKQKLAIVTGDPLVDLNTALGHIQWMSGADAFSPGGEAHEGWRNIQAWMEELWEEYRDVWSSLPNADI